ncbi:MAG: 50S ribosome-binding GTPase, partial [Pseudomonadota bacterium]|nr:50S ribosome-binding GTPase [Pseudomonadota bacterium]
GENRVIAFDEPGTTRDSIYIDFIDKDRRYTLIDTAGVRRRGKVFEAVEKFSVIKTLKAIEDANVVVLVLDAQQEISDQDAHLAGFVLEAGRGLVVAVNKWDGLEASRREWIKLELPRKLKFLDFARFHYISALQGQGMGSLLKSVDETYSSAFIRLPTPKLTRLLIEAVSQHQPPKNGPFRPKLRYAHQGGQNPPIVIVHGSGVSHVPESYRRYLENTFRRSFNVVGTPLKVEFHQGHNPFADRKPAPLTEREEKRAHRRRMHLRKTYGKKPKKD